MHVHVYIYKISTLINIFSYMNVGDEEESKVNLFFCQAFKDCTTVEICWCCTWGNKCYFTEDKCKKNCKGPSGLRGLGRAFGP